LNGFPQPKANEEESMPCDPKVAPFDNGEPRKAKAEKEQ